MGLRTTTETVKQHAAREMDLFDRLPACVRKVVSEHPQPASVYGIFTDNPAAFELAQAQPEYFAQILKSKLNQAQQVAASRTRAEVRRMMAEYANA